MMAFMIGLTKSGEIKTVVFIIPDLTIFYLPMADGA